MHAKGSAMLDIQVLCGKLPGHILNTGTSLHQARMTAKCSFGKNNNHRGTLQAVG